MANWGVLLVLVAAFAVHASPRNVPSDAGSQNEQKNFFPCIPKQPSNSLPNNEPVFVHASAPTAESPISTGLTDKKNFIYGGAGGFAGVGGYAGVIGGLPVLGGLGGIGQYGGIGGIGGIGGYTGGPGGLGDAGGGVGGLGGGAGGAAGGIAGGAAGGVGGAGGLGNGIFPCP